jgi:hypothetical protein
VKIGVISRRAGLAIAVLSAVVAVGCLATRGPPPGPIGPEESTRPPVDLSRVDRDRDLFGTVVDVHGDPVSGARVEALGVPLDMAADPWTGEAFRAPDEPATTTGADGSFVFRLPRGRFVHLRVSAPDYPTRILPLYQAGERVSVVLGEERRLEVLVVDERGDPASDLPLRLFTHHAFTRLHLMLPARTDGRGRAIVEGLGPGWVTVLAGHAIKGVPLPETGTTSIRIELTSGRTLEGLVRDGDTGAPIVGARVIAGWSVALTDDHGRYAIHGWSSLATGIDELTARARGYGARCVAIRDGGGVDFNLRRGDDIIGRVMDASGRPVASALVRAITSAGQVSATSDIFDFHIALTGPEGRFRMRGARRDLGPHGLFITAEGHGWARAQAQHAGGAPGVVDVGDLTLPAARVLEGVLRDRHGDPVPRALVTVSLPDAAGQGESEAAQTDDLGRFVFIGLNPGEHIVQWRDHRAFVTLKARRRVTISEHDPVDDVDLRPDPADCLILRIVDESGAPISGATVGSSSGRVFGCEETGRDGRTTLEKVGLGGEEVTLVVKPPEDEMHRFEFGRLGPIIVSGQEETIVLEDVHGVACVVHGPDGRPLIGARVTAVVRDDPSRQMGARTDETGRVVFEVPEGAVVDLDVNALADIPGDYERSGKTMVGAVLTGIREPAWKETMVAVEVSRDRSLFCLVLDPEGRPVPGVAVCVNRGRDSRQLAGTGSDGRAVLYGLPAIRIGCRVLSGDEEDRRDPARGFEPMAVSVIPDGQEIVFRYQRAAFFEGEVNGSDGRPASGVPVTVWCGNEKVGSTYTADGRFKVLGLAGRAHCIRAGSLSLGWAEAEDVVPGQGKIVLSLR